MMINYKTNGNYFRIKHKGVINVFYISQVTSLRLVKQRDFRLNITLICSAAISYAIATFISEIYTPVLVVAFLCAGLFFVLSLNYQAHSYKLMIITNQPNTIVLKANILEIEDIEQMVSKINKVLTTNRFNHAYTINEMSKPAALQ